MQCKAFEIDCLYKRLSVALGPVANAQFGAALALPDAVIAPEGDEVSSDNSLITVAENTEAWATTDANSVLRSVDV
jgi:hypothetical protein